MIISRPATSEYLEGYDRIFGKKEGETKENVPDDTKEKEWP